MIKIIPQNTCIKVFLASAFLCSFAGKASAQFQSTISSYVQAAQVDGNKLLQAYADPFLKRHADGWADGWTYTAAHEKFTFKLVSVSATFISKDEMTFDASKIGLSSNVRPTGTPINQTFAGGPNNNNAGFDVYGKNPVTGQDEKLSSFAGPDGVNFQVLGKSVAPTVVTPQIGFGVTNNIEVMARFLPSVTFGNNATISVFGLGVKHTLNEYLFGEQDETSKTAAPFDLAAYAGYSLENLGYKLDIEPTTAERASSGNENTNYTNQKIKMRTTDLTFGGIISKKFWIVTPHAGIGYSSGQTTLSAIGTYPVTVYGPAGLSTISNVQDPFLVSGAHSGLNANLGLNLNLYLIKINTDYVLSKYSRLNVGISLFF